MSSDDALNDATKAQDQAARWEHLARLEHAAGERWQAMAEDLWEELSRWHHQDGHLVLAREAKVCTCHAVLRAKWDEITHAADWADDDGDDE